MNIRLLRPSWALLAFLFPLIAAAQSLTLLPDSPQCQGVLGQDSIDRVSTENEDPLDAFEKRRRDRV